MTETYTKEAISALIAETLQQHKAVWLNQISEMLASHEAKRLREQQADQAVGFGKTNQHYAAPTKADLLEFADDKIKLTGLDEIVQAVAESQGITETEYMRRAYEGARHKEEANVNA